MTFRLARTSSIVIVLAAAALLPHTVQAHATLLKCSIAPGATISGTPRTITCTFAEGVNPKGSFIGVFQASGDKGQVDRENSAVSFSNAKQLSVSVGRLSKGTYNLIWYTISADDGHRAGGTFSFRIR